MVVRRTIQTFLAVLGGSLDPSLAIVDEYCRERFGRNTCDARSQAQSIQGKVLAKGDCWIVILGLVNTDTLTKSHQV